jgi:hypothetical protein
MIQNGTGFSQVNFITLKAEADGLKDDAVIGNVNTLYDADSNGIVDNSELVNGHNVELDIDNTPITFINVQDDLSGIF